MLGLAHHNIAVVSVILDRKRFWSHTILKSDPDWNKQLKSFFLTKDTRDRKRLVMFDDVSMIERLVAELYNSKDNNIVDLARKSLYLVFDTPDNLNVVPNISILDATKENESWKLHKIIPIILNDTFSEAVCGLPKIEHKIDLKKDPKIEALTQAPNQNVIFDPSKTLYFQHIENCLASIEDTKKQITLRRLIAAWHGGALPEDFSTKMYKRMEKMNFDVESYKSWSIQAVEMGYVDKLKKAILTVSSNPEKTIKDIAKEFGVRAGDIKWLNQNFEFNEESSMEEA